MSRSSVPEGGPPSGSPDTDPSGSPDTGPSGPGTGRPSSPGIRSGPDRGTDGGVDRGRDRGQVEPLAALAAVFAVGVAFSVYAVALGNAVPPDSDRDRAEPVLQGVADRVADGGVLAPADLPAGLEATPDGYGLRITLTVGEENWSAGPEPPDGVETAARPVSVRLAPGRVRTGTLRVEVWA